MSTSNTPQDPSSFNSGLPDPHLPDPGHTGGELPATNLPPLADEPSPEAQALHDARHAVSKVKHTRSRATYVGWIIGVVVAILLLVFIVQNNDSQEIDLIFGKVNLPIGVSLLIAAILGAIITMAMAAARIIELNRALKKVGKQSKKK